VNGFSRNKDLFDLTCFENIYVRFSMAPREYFWMFLLGDDTRQLFRVVIDKESSIITLRQDCS